MRGGRSEMLSEKSFHDPIHTFSQSLSLDIAMATRGICQNLVHREVLREMRCRKGEVMI